MGIRLPSSAKLWGGMIPAVRCTLDRVPIFCGAKVDLVPVFPIWECKGSPQYGTPRALTRMGIRTHGCSSLVLKGDRLEAKNSLSRRSELRENGFGSSYAEKTFWRPVEGFKNSSQGHGRDLHIASGTFNPSAGCPVKAAWSGKWRWSNSR